MLNPRISWMGLLLLSVGAPEAIAAGPVHLEAVEEAGIVHLVGRNSAPYPVTLNVELTESRNLAADRVTPLAAAIPAEGASTVLTLRRVDPEDVWRYRYRWSWTPGSLEARHDDGFLYEFPYPPGFSFIAHRDEPPTGSRPSQAISWRLPESTPVSAARGGTVVVASTTDSDVEPEGDAGVEILHDDGTLGSYSGLGVVSRTVGEEVETGERLGLAGPRGVLRFEVLRAVDGVELESVPVAFVLADGRGSGLANRTAYRRPDDGTGGTEPAKGAFAKLVTCRRVEATGPVETTDRFLPQEAVHVHLQLAVPDTYAIRVEFLRAGESEPRAVRRVQTEADWSGAAVVLDLAGIDDPEGDWLARAFVGDSPVGQLEFRVLAAGSSR